MTPGHALIRAPESMAWELRGAWASGARVALSLDRRCRWRRLEGHVRAVSPTGATATVNGWLVPLAAVLAVHKPSRLGDSTARGGDWFGRRYVSPQSEELPL